MIIQTRWRADIWDGDQPRPVHKCDLSLECTGNRIVCTIREGDAVTAMLSRPATEWLEFLRDDLPSFLRVAWPNFPMQEIAVDGWVVRPFLEDLLATDNERSES